MCMRCGTGSVAWCTGDHAAYEAELTEAEFWSTVTMIAYGLLIADLITGRTHARS